MFLTQAKNVLLAYKHFTSVPNHFRVAFILHGILLLSFVGSSISLSLPAGTLHQTAVLSEKTIDKNFIVVLSSPTPTLTPTPTEKPVFVPSIDPTVSVVEKSRAILLFEALNKYRVQQGRSSLAWDETLGKFAKERAKLFVNLQDTDSHAGFQSLINSPNGFQSMGFFALGENSSYGHNVSAEVLIQTAYGGHGPHNENQLNSEWTHVGIGASGVATDFVFAGRKM